MQEIKTPDNIVNPVPQYSQNVKQEKIHSLVCDFKRVRKADYLCRLLGSGECPPYGYTLKHRTMDAI